eukprot:253202-Pleurochrysis_carterae.AAC.1
MISGRVFVRRRARARADLASNRNHRRELSTMCHARPGLPQGCNGRHGGIPSKDQTPFIRRCMRGRTESDAVGACDKIIIKITR